MNTWTSNRVLLICICAFSAAFLLITGCSKPEMKPSPHAVSKAESHYTPHIRTRDYWPTKAWKTKSLKDVGISKKALDQVVEYTFKRTGNDKDRKGIRTDGMVVIKDGYLVYEKYARGFSKDTPHLSWSVSKSFVNALYGIAIKQKRCALDESASKYNPALRVSANHTKITLRHLLNMTPGLHWYEGYEAGILKSSVIAMLYGRGRSDMGGFASQFYVKYTPGTHFYYSSGTTNLAVETLRQILKKKKMEDFIWGELFDRIGMKKITWQRDGKGNVVGSSYLYAPPRQLAKFGYLYLNDGTWAGKRILPKGWVRFTTTTPKGDPKGRYGAQWWLNAGREDKGIPRRLPAAPRDLFMASGHWGQRIIVSPSHDLVVVLTADNRDKTFKLKTFAKLLMAALPKTPVKTAQPVQPRTAPAQPSPAKPQKRPTAHR